MATRILDTSARLRPLILAALAPALSACIQPNQFLPTYQPGNPQGILGGTVTYAGPMPCTENQHVVGAAVLLAFDTRLLPPPEGLGTTATSLAAVGGDQLFGGIVDRLTFNKDGSKWCPSASDPPVTVSGDWTLGALPGAEYEVRGFYDLNGTFNPVFSITKTPTKGDIAGGAIDNAAEVLQGLEPVYRRIALGTQDPTTGDYNIPDTGSNIDGIAVTLALPLPLGLPIFYPSTITEPTYKCQGSTPVMQPPSSGVPTHVKIPADFQLAIYDPGNLTGTEASLVRVTAAAGLPSSEALAGSKSPFNLPVYPKPDPITYSWQDVNQDNMINIAEDHAPASTLLPALLPLAIFSKLQVSSPPSPADGITAQASPAVILQGITIYKTLFDTITWSPNPNPNDPSNSRTDTQLIVGITPAVVCMNPTDFAPDAKAVLALSHPKDCAGHPLLANAPATILALEKQFGRHVVVANAMTDSAACLPQGKYALNLVYGTGQAWSNPNEAGVCQEGEPQMGNMCVATVGSRPLLPSQNSILEITAPTDAAYCTAHPVPDCCTDASKCKCLPGECQ